MSRADTRRGQGGFTLLEVLLVLVLLVPTIGMVLTSSGKATRSMASDEVVARTLENLQRSAERIAHAIRPCSLATYRMRADQSDVDDTRASAIGEWIDNVDGQARTGMRFQSASGTMSLNASALGGQQTVWFRISASETANGIDDDDDGMVDEGEVVLDRTGSSVVLATNVELCTFTLTGRMLQVTLRAAVRTPDGRVSRFRVVESLYLRNN